MADAQNEIPSIDIQRRETERLLAKPLVSNETWYLVHSDWFKSFKSYIRLDKNWDDGHEHEHPGPIDNSSLYKDGDATDIRDHLVEEVDYVFVPEELWHLLVKWYGMVTDQLPIPKKVIEYGRNAKNTKIEVYPLPLRLIKDFDMDKSFVHKFSKANTIGHVAKVIKELFGISDEVVIKLWGLFSPNSCDELNFSKTIEEESLFPDQVVVAEACRPDGTCIKPSKNAMNTNSMRNSLEKSGSLNMSTKNNPGPSVSRVTRFHTSYSGNNDVRCGSVTPGLCGLCNMGNTCFMNSVIQCLSNCPPLVKHFAEDEYLKDLNTENPIGMKGKIATAFGELIKIMWSGKYPFAVPNNFKEQVGTFAPQFSGYQQQDSQELLTFLLDGLHEDLNKIKQKPYIAMSDSDGRPDEIVASEAWEIYQKRNDSIIVDYFHGLLKSTVVCPDCAKISVTFDPFCHLSLPLPIRRERYIEVTFFPSDLSKKPQVITTMVPKKGHVNDLLCALSHQCGVSPDELVVTEITKHHFHKFYSSNDALENIDSKEDIAVLEVPHMCKSDDNHVKRDIATASTSCKCTSPENICHLLPNDLFSLHVVNASTTSVVFKLHNDGNPIQMPISDVIGRQYLAAQWTTENRKQYLNSFIQNEIDGRDSGRQKRSHKVQLKDCLELFTMCEKLGADDAWYCPDCKQHQRATKKFDLWKLPKILIIHLKRFSYSRFRRDKIDSLVEFPLRDLDMSKYIINDKHPPAKYNLIGICNHYGGMGGGHYTAYALNKIDKQWYCFDDHNVSPKTPENVVTNSAYVLFYIRSD
ncbi:Ubiquitin carboxyl-terminal hydrolase 32 [Gryllus bimaculatus]|nr:Ubiquitin carboxyl-terminal hydrolase 32 [Gryllus bimaculatus]